MSVIGLSGLFQVSVQKNAPLSALLESDGTNYASTGKYGKGDPTLAKSNGIPFYDEIASLTGAHTTWHTLVAMQANIGIPVQQEVEQPMIAGSNFPTGAFKTGTSVSGSAAVPARLAGKLGFLLYGGLGGYKYLNTTPPVGVTLPANTFVHRYSARPTLDATTPGGSGYLPFMAFRRYIPGRNTNVDLGQVGYDCMISSLSIDIPQVGEVTTSINVIGRLPYKTKPDEAQWKLEGGDLEPSNTNAMASKGTIQLPGFLPFRNALNDNYPVPSIGATITINNNLTSEREERVIGSYYLDDLVAKRRTVTVEMTYKWESPELSRFIFNQGRRYEADAQGSPYELGDATNEAIDRMREFDPCLYPTPFRAILESPCEGQMLVIDLAAVQWQADGDVKLEGDNLLTQKYTGTALLPQYTFASQYSHTETVAGQSAVADPTSLSSVGDAADIEYCSIYLINGQTDSFYTGTNGLTSMTHS